MKKETQQIYFLSVYYLLRGGFCGLSSVSVVSIPALRLFSSILLILNHGRDTNDNSNNNNYYYLNIKYNVYCVLIYAFHFSRDSERKKNLIENGIVLRN